MTIEVRRVMVEATPLWQDAASPRDVERPVLQDEPDHAAWLAGMDAHTDVAGSRAGLLDRIETEALLGEPAVVSEDDGAWAKVTLPWQPTKKHPLGYPGYLRSAHLKAEPGGYDGPFTDVDRTVDQLLAEVRAHVGVGYLWGGISPAGIDCSGLIHSAYRRLGIVVPRDADDQAAAAMSVVLGTERPGDLYFFARPGSTIHHVGMVVEPGVMLHAPQTGATVVQERLTADRRITLAAAGRFAIA